MQFSEVPVACADAAWLSREFLPNIEAKVVTEPCLVVLPTDSHEESEFLLSRAKRFLEQTRVGFIRELRLSPTDPSLAWESIFGTPDARSAFDSATECDALLVRGGNYLPAWFLLKHVRGLGAYAKSYRIAVLLPVARSVVHAAGSSTVLAVPSFPEASEQLQRSFVAWAIEQYVNDLGDRPPVDRHQSREELNDIICQARPRSRSEVEFWLRHYVAEFERQDAESVLDVAQHCRPRI